MNDFFPPASGRSALLWLALPLMAACHREAPAPTQARPVIAMPAPAASSTGVARFPGEVHARYEMPLSFRVPGQLVARRVHLGDMVKKGELLAQLDGADAARNVASARASLQAAEHRLAYASDQRRRDEAQAKADLISQQQLEQTRDAYASALAARDQAKAQLALAQNQSQYTRLLADRDGRITREQAEVGQVLAAGQAVFGFAWSGDRDIYIDVPETQVTQIRPGQHADVAATAIPGKHYRATVRDVSPAADPQARTYRVKLALEGEGRSLPLGMSTEVALASHAQLHGIRLPATALFHRGDQPAVWVMKRDATLELRPVKVVRYGERSVLVDGGLATGEQVVMQGVHTVSAGEKVVAIAPPHPEDAP